MSDLFDTPDDATPLEPEEREGLIPTWIAFRHELNEAEQANIAALRAADDHDIGPLLAFARS